MFIKDTEKGTYRSEKMNKKILITILGLVMLTTIVSFAKAEVNVSIEVKDDNPGNNIAGQIVPINTVACVYGHYEELDGSLPSIALIEVFYDDGSGWEKKATLFFGVVNDGDTIIAEPYTLTEFGAYQFSLKSFFNHDPPQVTATVYTGTQFVIPEPGTIAGLMMALAAFGFLATKRMTRTK